MPQLEQFWSYPSQILWLIITFGVLFALLRLLVLPRISDVLADRQQRVSNDLGRAQELKGEAETVLEAYEAELAEARVHAQENLREAGGRATAEAARRQEALSVKLQADSEAAAQRIAAARDAALDGVGAVAGELAAAAAERLIGTAPDAERTADAVAAALAAHR